MPAELRTANHLSFIEVGDQGKAAEVFIEDRRACCSLVLIQCLSMRDISPAGLLAIPSHKMV